MEYFTSSFPCQQQDRRVNSFNSERDQQFSITTRLSPLFSINQSSGTIEPKPRLGKEEVNKLEREFRRNPKPSTQTKKAFAEEMNVDLPRINNWFQNRRAKRKQEIKLKKEEAIQAPEISNYPTPTSPDLFLHGKDRYSDDRHVTSESILLASCESNKSPYSPESMKVPNTKTQSFRQHSLPLRNESPTVHNAYFLHNSTVCNPSQTLGNSNSSHNGLSGGHSFECTQSFGTGNLHLTPQLSPDTLSAPSNLDNQISLSTSPPQTFSSNYNTLHPHNAIISAQFMNNETILPLSPQSCFSQSNEDCLENKLGTNTLSFEHAEQDFPQKFNDFDTPIYGPEFHPESLSSPPAPSNINFRSRPPTNIALRRKKVQHRPAALIAHTIGCRPVSGPSSVSHVEGSHLLAKGSAELPIRRIVSAGGNRAVVSGRIQKHGFDMSQRSPINIGSFENVGTIMEYNLHNIYHPPSLTSLSTSFSPLSGSLAPSTPSDLNSSQQDGFTPKTSSGEGSHNFLINYNVPNYLIPIDEKNHSLNSTKNCPSLPLGQNSFQSWTNFNDFEHNCSYKPYDETSYLTVQDEYSHGFQLNETLLADSISQPTTPAFAPPSESNCTFDQTLSPDKNDSYIYQVENDYLFNDPICYPEKPPNELMGEKKIFQFSHSTPADFFER